MVTVYFIRHGESEANVKGIIQGHAEFPLTELGKKQAELAGEGLAETHLDALFTSDLERARITAEKIVQHHPILAKPWEMVREIGLGPLEGKTRAQMYVQFPELKRESLLTSGIDGTEAVDDVSKRCAYVVEQLIAAYKNKTVAVVSHGGFISIFLMYLIAGKQWSTLKRPFMIGNTSITKITIDSDGTSKFHFINRTDHLEREEGSRSSTALY